MDISPEAWNTQDTIHRPNEAQEGRTKYGYFGPSLGENKIHIEGGSMEQRLKERPSRDYPTWGSIPYNYQTQTLL